MSLIQTKRVLPTILFLVVLLGLIVPVGRARTLTSTISAQGMINYGRIDGQMWGICGVDLAFEPFGIYFGRRHIDMLADVGANSIRQIFSWNAWRDNVIVGTYRGEDVNVEYAGWTMRDYMKDLADYAKTKGIQTLYEMNFDISTEERILIYRDIHPTVRRQDWIDIAKEVVAVTGCEAIGVCDEPFGGKYVTDWDADISQHPTEITSPEWYDFVVDFIEGVRGINPNVTVATFGVSLHYFNMFYKYDSVIGPGGKAIRIKGQGPLPYPNIVYLMNKPGYAGSSPRQEMWDYLDYKVGPLSSYPEFLTLNQKIAFTCAFAFNYDGFPDGANRDYPAGWQTYSKDFWDYNKQRGFDCYSYAFPNWYRYSLLYTGPGPQDRYTEWNDIGLWWAGNVPGSLGG